MMRVNAEVALDVAKAAFPKEVDGQWTVQERSGGCWRVECLVRGQPNRGVVVCISPMGSIQSTHKWEGRNPNSSDKERYTFEIQSEAPGSERVLLCIDDAPWNEFTGPVAKGVIALIQGRK